MNRKANPWVSLIALILTLVLVVCICTGCVETTEAEETKGPRFTVEIASDDSSQAKILIITDTETGVQYIFFSYGQSGGLSVLEPAPEKEAEE